MLCLSVLVAPLPGCSTPDGCGHWCVFYNSEKGPDRLSIAREPKPLSFYTNRIPDWNYDLRVPSAKILSAETTKLGEINELRIMEVRLSLSDIYYSDAQILLQEVKPNGFLPVYVQDYNRNTRTPCTIKTFQETTKLEIG